MAFRKTSVAVETPIQVTPPPVVGEVREGRVWDGQKWIPEKEWKDRETDQGST